MGEITAKYTEIFKSEIEEENDIGYIVNLKTYDIVSEKDQTLVMTDESEVIKLLVNRMGSILWRTCQEVYIYPISYKEKPVIGAVYKWTEVVDQWKGKNDELIKE